MGNEGKQTDFSLCSKIQRNLTQARIGRGTQKAKLLFSATADG